MASAYPSLLAINGGSSSIKFALYETRDPLRRKLSGALERIGSPGATLRVQEVDDVDSFSRTVTAPDFASAVEVLMNWLEKRRETFAAVGHRVVQGGPNYTEPRLITAEMVAELRRLSPFDPEHLPEEIRLMEAFEQRFPDMRQVACFDTAFHHDLPRVAKILPIPRRYEARGVRRYGFHGLSYAFLAGELERVAGAEAAGGRVILAHLGSGASLAALWEGRCIDTSMGFTPTAGLVMGTRSGDLDPGLVTFLTGTGQMTGAEFQHMVNHESGLRGVSETSGDLQDLLACENEDVRAAEAVELFCYQTRKWIGSFAAALTGLDTLVFAGGIGEHAPAIRARICAGLAFLGIDIDPGHNADSTPLISSEQSRVQVRVIHTDEEIMIARSVLQVLGNL